MPSQRNAFSLVELSIVLVILGLLAGGILAGQALIRASELRSVSKDFDQFQTAIQAFRDKYFAIPGDITNAYSFWGTTLGCTNATGSAGCNGNGDWQIGHNGSEMYREWQHLTSAGLIQGNYSGVAPSAGVAVIGVDVPASKINNAGYNLSYVTPSGYLAWAATISGNWMTFGGQRSGSLPNGGAIMPEEAWNLDSKFDDGLPGTGRLAGGRGIGASTTCTSGAGAAATYNLNITGLGCALAFRIN